MKKLITILFLLFAAFIVKAQYPVNQTIGADSTLVTSKGGLKGRLINFVFADTATANLQRIRQYPGAQIVTYKPSASDSGTIWLRNGTATKWLRGSGSIDITSITFDNDTTGIICFSNGVCDTFQINNFTDVVNNLIQNFNDSTVFHINDSTIVICNGAGVCDTIHLGNTNNFFFLNDSTIVTCDETVIHCIGDSCYTTTLCDTISVPKITSIFYQNGLQKIPNSNIVEFGNQNVGNSPANIIHETHLYSPYNLFVEGSPAFHELLSTRQLQWSQLSSSISSFNHNGAYHPGWGLLDDNNPVNLYLNYTDPFAIPTQGTLAGDTVGFMGNRYGYLLMTNSRGIQNSYAIDDINAKQVGILFDTYSDNNEAITIFGNQLPSAYAFSANPPTDSTLLDARIAVFKTTGQVQLPKYTTGAFPITSPTYIIAQDASGNLFQYPPGGLPVGPGTGLLFARDDARNNSGVQMYFSSANKDMLWDSINTIRFNLDSTLWLSGLTSGLTLYMNDQFERFQIFDNNDVYFDIDPVNRVYQLGQVDGFGNHTELVIDDINQTWSARNIPSGVGTKAIRYDPATDLLTYADTTVTISGITADNGLTASTATNVQLGGTLLKDTYITGSGFSLEVDGNNFVNALRGVNSDVGSGVYGSSVGGYGVYGTGVAGVVGYSTLGEGGIFSSQPSSTNTVVNVLRVERYSSGTPVDGMGGAIQFQVQTPVTSRVSNELKSSFVTIADATRTSQLDITGVNSASTGTIASFYGSGVVGIGISSAYNSTRLDVVDATSALSANSKMASFTNSGETFNTTGSNLTSFLGYFNNTASRSSGANNLTNIGVYSTATGGQINYAGYFDGDVRVIGINASIATLQVTNNSIGAASIVDITSTSTAAASNLQKGINVSLSGANATSTQTTYAGYFSNTHSGTSPTNYAVYGTISNGSSSNSAISGNADANQNGTAGTSSSGNGIFGSSSSGNGGNFLSQTGIALISQSNGNVSASFTAFRSATNSVVEMARIQLATSGTAANGLGGALTWLTETADESSTVYESARIASTWTTATTASRTGDLQFWTTNSTASTKWMTIAGDGTVTMHKYGAGTATFDASGVISSVSDERVKTGISSFNYGLNELMKINPITYRFNGLSGNETKHTYAGFSAQNVYSVLGDLGTGITSDGYMTLQDRSIIALLVNSVKEQQLEIEALKRQINKK